MTTTRDNNEKECALSREKKKTPVGGRACKQRAQRRAKKQGTMRDKKYRDKTKREARTK